MPTAAAKAKPSGGPSRALTDVHHIVLGVLRLLRKADAALVAEVLDVSEADAAQVLADLEAAGYVTSATGRCNSPFGTG